MPGRRIHRRAALAAALLAALVVMASCEPKPGSDAGPGGAAALDEMGCGDEQRWAGVEPIAADPEGPIVALSATSDAPDLSGSKTLFVRVEMADGASFERLLIDTDMDRFTGMWTVQSHLSASGWNFMADESGLYEHSGAPTEWKFDRIDAGDFSITRQGDAYLFCLPAEVLGGGAAPSAVALAAENSDASLPAQFLEGARFAGPAVESQPPSLEQARISLPGRLTFNYSGMPWVVRGCRDPVPNEASLACATTVYRNFDHIVLDADFAHESSAGVERLIARVVRGKREIEIWGYVSLVGSTIGADGARDRAYTAADIAALARRWKRAGATGVFLDEFDICDPSYETCHKGPEGRIEVTRAHQVEAVEAIHSLGLAVFANGHSVLDSLGMHRGVPTPLGQGDGDRRADMYLLENPTISGGTQVTGLDFRGSSARFEQAVLLGRSTGVRLAVLDTVATAIPDDANASPDYALGWWRAVQAGATAYAFANAGPAHFDGNLPLLGPPPGIERPFAFAPGSFVRSRGGAVVERRVVDCTGREVGSVRVTESPEGVTASFERTAEDDPGC